MGKVSLTVIMITLNEEYHIGKAIDNVSDIAENIFIVDSLSYDRTVDIAIEKGASIIQRPFTNFGDQWNFALNNNPFDTDWVMKIDPDERLSKKLKNQIRETIDLKDSLNAYELKTRLWFMGKPLHVSMNLLRLWKSGMCKFSNVQVNEHALVKGNIGLLDGYLEHHDSRDLHHWMEKQNLYTTREANRFYKSLEFSVPPNFFGTKMERKMFFKKHFFKIPFRYTLQFIYELFFRKAYLSGANGVRWVKSRIKVRKLIELKIKEAKIKGSELYIPNNNNKLIYNKKVLESELQINIFKVQKINK